MMQHDLLEYENRIVTELSGGNKRKLCVAMSTIGNPRVVLLDEPSTGVDPISRRHLWDIISEIIIKKNKSTIILTTHNMEEAEALCGFVGIMVKGRFQYFGCIDELKGQNSGNVMVQLKIPKISDEEIMMCMKRYRIEKENMNNQYNDSDYREKVLNSIDEKYASFLRNSDGDISSKTPPISLVETFAIFLLGELKYKTLLTKLDKLFSQYEILERNESFITVKLKKKIYSMGDAFDIIESNKELLKIQDFSISEASLPLV